jgi:hypothetical protein
LVGKYAYLTDGIMQAVSVCNGFAEARELAPQAVAKTNPELKWTQWRSLRFPLHATYEINELSGSNIPLNLNLSASENRLRTNVVR